jgi:hypothetical protein
MDSEYRRPDTLPSSRPKGPVHMPAATSGIGEHAGTGWIPVLPFSFNDPSRRPGRGAGRTHRARMPGLPPQIENRKSENEKGPRSEAGASKDPGNDLLSHTVSHAVSSALEGLTAVFGMGTGVAPPPRSPESRQNSLRPNHRRGISRPVVRPKEQSGVPGKPLGFAGMAISRSSLTTD